MYNENDRPISDEELVEVLVADSLISAFKEVGIERTEEIFKGVWKDNKKALAVYEKVYDKLVWKI